MKNNIEFIVVVILIISLVLSIITMQYGLIFIGSVLFLGFESITKLLRKDDNDNENT